MSGRESYYRETIESASEECDLTISSEQAVYLADAVVVARENEGMAFGDYCIPNPLQTELDNTKQRHKKESAARERQYEENEKYLREEIRHLRIRLRNALER